MSTQASPVASWETTSAQWVIPQHIVDQAPESPCVHRLANFALGLGDTAQTASQQCACQLLVESGTALDAGCGGGQSSVPLVRAATSITGVDEQESMLQSFAMAWENTGVAHSEVLGRWPAIAAHVVPADVAVCHHVVYNVADIESFLRELSAHTRRGVMVELPS